MTEFGLRPFALTGNGSAVYNCSQAAEGPAEQVAQTIPPAEKAGGGRRQLPLKAAARAIGLRGVRGPIACRRR